MHEKLPFSWKWSNEIREADLRDNEDDSPRYEKLFEKPIVLQKYNRQIYLFILLLASLIYRCCTACFKTCRGVPSVGCDFCSSIYHLDCLDPPLCEIPRVRKFK